MANVPATGAAALAVVLIGAALFGMANGNLRLAGFSFLCASLTIYLRESYLLDA
ncbi:hypothetical protein [Halosegnis sp.]|uniref:hypothetical protein n=1 Tax=Halosegnis sp. TaxID=2864959 RepID=UPI0035D4EBCC